MKPNNKALAMAELEKFMEQNNLNVLRLSDTSHGKYLIHYANYPSSAIGVIAKSDGTYEMTLYYLNQGTSTIVNREELFEELRKLIDKKKGDH